MTARLPTGPARRRSRTRDRRTAGARTPGGPTLGGPSLGRQVLRRTVGTVVAAAVGALAATLVVSAVSGPSPLVEDAVPDRTERPSRAQPREHGATVGLTARLLPATALAAPGAGTTWRVLHTEAHEPRTLAASCHRYPLVSVGAMRVAHRAYRLRGTDDSGTATTAEHVVARFADARTAWRAQQVLESWHTGCREALADRDGLRVSPTRGLAGGAQQYAITWTADAALYREDVAVLRGGSHLALVRVTADAGSAREARAVATAAIDAAGRLLPGD